MGWASCPSTGRHRAFDRRDAYPTRDYSDETTLITTTTVDDVWSAGYVGLYRAASTNGAIQQYDDLKIGYDNNGDGDILDAGDTIQVADDFNSNTMTLSYDDNGNLINDGVSQYVYDAWNRLVKAQRKAAHAGQADDVTTFGEYQYLGDNRRASKAVTHSGVEATLNDGGNTTLHYYYCGTGLRPVNWQICEERNGSNQSLRQYLWGTQYVDELIFLDVNGNPGNSNDCDPDTTAQGETGQDRRYFVHQDRNWNVIALTEYNDGAGSNGRIAERYTYTPYGEFAVLKGDSGSGNLGNVLPTSTVGNVFTHQGLAFDQDKAKCTQWAQQIRTILGL